ncbi:MAG: hypothetical protein ABI759_22805 [Candidatus Solibacter sp.]
MKRAILLVTFAAVCGAQTTVNGGRDYKGTLKASGSISAVDFTGAANTAPVKAGTLAARPTACTQGHIYFATDATAGQNLYFCTTTGTPGVWSQMSGSSASITAGASAPSGNCTPPALAIDTTSQELWYCGAANSWKKPEAGLLSGSNTWTGTNTLTSGQLRATGGGAAIDFSGAASTAPVKAGTTAGRPSACTLGQLYFATDAGAGQNLFFCTATGAPGVWTQMTGGSADTSSLGALGGANTWTGYNNFAGGQWRPPESTVAGLPPAAANQGKVFMVTDAVNAGTCSTGGGSVRELCRAGAAAYECVGGCGSGSGGAANTAYISSLLAGPDLTRTIPGSVHGFATTALVVAVYDNAMPREAISAGWSVNPANQDVTITFAVPQSNYYVVINGGVGPMGPQGPQGPQGPAGTSGTGTGSVNPSGTIGVNRLATFADASGTLIQDAVQHSLGNGYLSTTKLAGGGGVTANLLCKIDATGNVILPGAGDVGVLGVCVTSAIAAQTVEVATGGVVNCVADNSTTAGNVAVVGTTTAGRCRDSGQANTTGVALSTQVLGKILASSTAGSLVAIELYGPGHYGAAVQISDGGTGMSTYAKGDLLTSTGGASLSRLPAGGDGQSLVADSSVTTGVKWAGSNRRTCVIENDTQSATPLSAAQITGRCEIPFAAHLVEVGVWGGTGTGTQVYTGSSSIQLTRLRPNGGGTAAVLSAALASPGASTNSNKVCAVAAVSGTCGNGLASSGTVSLAGGVPLAVNAGDAIYVSSATADGVQTWYTITITYTAD